MTPAERDALISRLASLIYPDGKDEDFEELKGKLGAYSDTMLARLGNGAEDEDSELYFAEYLISDGEVESRVNEALFFLGEIEAVFPSYVINAVQGLRITKSLPSYEDYSTADEAILRKCIALVGITVALMDCSHEIKGENLLVHERMGVRYASAIRDEKLAQLVMDHADHYEVIERAIYERLTGSAEVISEVLESSTPSLAEGVL